MQCQVANAVARGVGPPGDVVRRQPGYRNRHSETNVLQAQSCTRDDLFRNDHSAAPSPSPPASSLCPRPVLGRPRQREARTAAHPPAAARPAVVLQTTACTCGRASAGRSRRVLPMSEAQRPPAPACGPVCTESKSGGRVQRCVPTAFFPPTAASAWGYAPRAGWDPPESGIPTSAARRRRWRVAMAARRRERARRRLRAGRGCRPPTARGRGWLFIVVNGTLRVVSGVTCDGAGVDGWWRRPRFRVWESRLRSCRPWRTWDLKSHRPFKYRPYL